MRKTRKAIEIDLHGLRHATARIELLRFIETFYNSEKECIIITGNSEKMKEIVIDILKEYGMEYREGDIFGINNGYIKTWL